MKNTSFLNTFLIAIAICIAGYFISNTLWTSAKNNRVVNVKGLAEKTVDANLAVWPLEVVITGNNLNTINAQIDRQKKIVTTYFTGKGFLLNEITIGVTNIQDANASLYKSKNTNFRYLSKTEITIRTTDINKIKIAQKEIIKLTAKDVLINSKNQWRPIDYFFTDLNRIKPEMVEEATKKAKEVAEKFAQDSNSKVGKIKTASQGLFSIRNRDTNTPEVKKVRVVTSIKYFLED